MTIHITPESEFSYVSFETNASAASYREIISKVLKIFNPGKFTITLFANQSSPAREAPKDLHFISNLGDWNRREMQMCQFKNYDLTYLFFSKFPSWGCPAPVRLFENNSVNRNRYKKVFNTPFWPKTTKHANAHGKTSLIFILVYVYDDFGNSALIMFCWWRTKISWDMLRKTGG